MPAKSALLVIDVQQDLFSGENAAYQADEVLERIAGLAARAREAGVPVVYVQHDGEPTDGLCAIGTPGWEMHPTVAPQEGHKINSDGFYRTNLDETLRGLGAETLYVTGFASQFCVDATTRRATSEGYDVVLVSDAHTTFPALEGSPIAPEQIIAHHNATLPNLAYRHHKVVTQPAAEVDFAAAETPAAA
jgi:nicotinamidase-related amidase